MFLDDPRDFAGFNKVYAQFFTAEHAPARVCVQAMMMSDLRVGVMGLAKKTKRKRDMRLEEGKENLSEEGLFPPQTPPLPPKAFVMGTGTI